MKVVDILIIIVLLFGAYMGYKKGLLVEVISFFAFIIAIISAFKLLNNGINFLSAYLEGSRALVAFASFILIFLLVFLLIHFLGKMLKNTLNYTLIGKFDNVAGALLGMAKIAFALSLLLWLGHSAKIEVPGEYTRESFLYEELIVFAPKLVKVVSYVVPFQDIFPAVKEVLKK